MNAVQCRMARTATGITVRELAQRAQVAVDTVTRLERGEVLRPRTVKAMKAVLQDAGAIFVDNADEGTSGVLVKPKANHG